MNELKKYKLISIVVFILLIIFFFILFAAVKNIIDSSAIENPGIMLYFSLIATFILGLGLFIISIQLAAQAGRKTGITNQELNEALNNRAAATTEEVKKEENTEKTEQTVKLDAGRYAKKIVPSLNKDDNAQIFSEKLLRNFAKEFDIVQGLFFMRDEKDEFSIIGEYAYYSEEQPRTFTEGDTLPGQVAKNKKLLKVPNIPEGYITILSGLGKSSPRVLLIIPLIVNDKTQAIIELASFADFDDAHILLLEDLSTLIAEKFSNLTKKS